MKLPQADEIGERLREAAKHQEENLRQRLGEAAKRQEESLREKQNHQAVVEFLPRFQTAYLLLLDGKGAPAVKRLEEFAVKHADTSAGTEVGRILNLLQDGKVEDARLRLRALIDQHRKTR